jgi:hypothetical protein
MSGRTQVSARLMILGILFVAAGCAPQSTQPAEPSAVPPAPTLPSMPSPTVPVEATSPSGWETYTNQGECSYAISHPSNMDGTSQGTYSWNLSVSASEPVGLVANFIYISVIPDGFQGGEDGSIYNYHPAETQTLLNMPVGESRSLRDFDPDLAPWFTYTRLPDTTLGNQATQAYENPQPWEFPAGTKELRYYLKANGCTYLIGGYMATVGSGQPGAIDQGLFDQILATFRLAGS